MKTLSFIGTGNMGGALLAAAARGMETGSICITDRDAAKAAAQAEAYGCRLAEDNTAAAAAGDYVMLCVKPQVMPAVARELAPILKSARQAGRRQVIVTIAAGITMESLARMLDAEGEALPVIRLLPNTPAAVGEGLTLLSCRNVSQEETDEFCAMLAASGSIVPIEEHFIDAAGVLNGCAPAFVYLFIEAMADGGVAAGLPRAQAQQFAAQAVKGAAAMVLQTGKHPGQLKDEVCSPGGSTIVGVETLEKSAFRSTAMEAVLAACAKMSDLGRQK